MPSVDGAYWLNDYGESGLFAYRDYANYNNTLDNNTLLVSGKRDSLEFDNDLIASGPYAYTKTVTNLRDYTKLKGGYYSLSGGLMSGYRNVLSLNRHSPDRDWFNYKTTMIYNNPQLLNYGTDSSGKSYRGTYADGNYPKMDIIGIVNKERNYRLERVVQGQYIPAGTTVVVTTSIYNNQWKDTTDFIAPDNVVLIANGYSDIIKTAFTGFCQTNTGFFVNQVTSGSSDMSLVGYANYYPTVYVGYFQDYYFLTEDRDITATRQYATTRRVRPIYDLTSSEVAFARDATSGENLSTSSTFGNAPDSVAMQGGDKKLVVKSDATTIKSNISVNNISTEKTADGHASLRYSDGVIKVPYGSKKLTINSSALSTDNATHVSALADCNGSQKYAVLGKVGQNLEIDLSSIVNINQIGSTVNLSIFAENASSTSETDTISRTPVSLQIEVMEGPEQTIKFNLGGGTGNKPEDAKVNAGKSYTLPDGSSLSKDGNLFARWELSYTPYGETSAVDALYKGNEAIVVPDASNYIITATAKYSGIKASKSTESESSVITVTWDTNSPDGFSATFSNMSSGNYNSARTQKYDKVKDLKANKVDVPGDPEINTDQRIFNGWWTDPVKGTEVKTSVTVDKDITYYAHWLSGYTVTYDATGGTGASMSGTFSDGTTTDSEIVLPGKTTVGPGKGNPEPNDSTYMFEGWYYQPNGQGGPFDETATSFDDLGGPKTVYAYYVLPKTFLAPATSSVTANPRTINGTKYSIEQVKREANDIASKITSPSTSAYYSKYKEWMDDDSYHLYTLLNGKNPDTTDSWVEFRIVNVGQLDNDGTGLTFQAIHMLPTAYPMNSKSTNVGGWGSCALRSKMQSGGEIYNMFDLSLTSLIYKVSRNSKGELWIPSYSELTGTSSSKFASDGSQFAFWKGKVRLEGANDWLTIRGKRSGSYCTDISDHGRWWGRTPDGTSSSHFLYVPDSGDVNDFSYMADYRYGVDPCFSL